MEQPTLFADDVCAGHHRNNPESAAAYLTIEPHVTRLQLAILRYGAGRDTGFTVKTVCRDVDGCAEHQTASARLTELLKAGLVQRTAIRIARCAVLELTDAGREALKKSTGAAPVVTPLPL